MEDYCFALRTNSTEAIWNVVNGLREGTVKGASTQWSPRAPELAVWVREEQARLDSVADVERRRSVKKLNQDEQRSEERSAEHRVRMTGLWELLTSARRGDKSSSDELNRIFPNAKNPWIAKYPNIYRLGEKP